METEDNDKRRKMSSFHEERPLMHAEYDYLGYRCEDDALREKLRDKNYIRREVTRVVLVTTLCFSILGEFIYTLCKLSPGGKRLEYVYPGELEKIRNLNSTNLNSTNK